jgi:hypothetical protein
LLSEVLVILFVVKYDYSCISQTALQKTQATMTTLASLKLWALGGGNTALHRTLARQIGATQTQEAGDAVLNF